MTPQASQQFIYCPYTGIKLSAVAARNCNYCNLETYICSHSGEFCVAKEGLEEFAQSLTEDLPVKALEVFQKIREDLELEKRKKNLQRNCRYGKTLKMKASTPALHSFYVNNSTPPLLYFLGNNGKDYVFDARIGQSIIRQPFFEKHLTKVTDLEDYLQKHPEEKLFVMQHTQSQP